LLIPSRSVNKHGHHRQFLFLNGRFFYTPAPRRGRGVYCFTSVRLSILPSFQDIFRRIFLSNYQWQKSDIVGIVFGSVRFLLPVCRLSWFLYTLNIYAHFSSHFSQSIPPSPSGERGYKKIGHSETRIACGGHVC
jgi:hypothetical protein